MVNLTMLRVGLTVGAIVGLVPITLLFAVGTISFFLPAMLFSENPAVVVPVLVAACLLSIFGIGSAWKIYVVSMSALPHVRSPRLLASAAVITTAWGFSLACMTRTIPQGVYIFLMPGITSAIMLAITLKRAQA